MRGTTTARVDVEEQRRKDLEDYQKYGAIRRRLHDLPEFQRDLKGPKLPENKVPLTSNVTGAPVKFHDLEKQRTVDIIRRQLYDAFTSRKRGRSNDHDNNDQ